VSQCRYCKRTIYWTKRDGKNVAFEDSTHSKRHDCELAPWHGGSKPEKAPSAPMQASPAFEQRLSRLESIVVELRRDIEEGKAPQAAG
jgi:hypothetical protein